MANELILIVEDNDKNMKLFRDVLQATGYRTLQASTARQALTAAIDHRPTVILMDIRLPDMSGVEALRALRDDARTANIPVIAVTAQAMEGDRARFIDAGFDGYLSKPVDIDAFLATVQQHCRTGRLRSGGSACR